MSLLRWQRETAWSCDTDIKRHYFPSLAWSAAHVWVQMPLEWAGGATVTEVELNWGWLSSTLKKLYKEALRFDLFLLTQNWSRWINPQGDELTFPSLLSQQHRLEVTRSAARCPSETFGSHIRCQKQPCVNGDVENIQQNPPFLRFSDTMCAMEPYISQVSSSKIQVSSFLLFSFFLCFPVTSAQEEVCANVKEGEHERRLRCERRRSLWC